MNFKFDELNNRIAFEDLFRCDVNLMRYFNNYIKYKDRFNIDIEIFSIFYFSPVNSDELELLFDEYLLNGEYIFLGLSDQPDYLVFQKMELSNVKSDLVTVIPINKMKCYLNKSDKNIIAIHQNLPDEIKFEYLMKTKLHK